MLTRSSVQHLFTLAKDLHSMCIFVICIINFDNGCQTMAMLTQWVLCSCCICSCRFVLLFALFLLPGCLTLFATAFAVALVLLVASLATVEAFDLLKKAESELSTPEKRYKVDCVVSDARMFLIKDLKLPLGVHDDHPSIKALHPPFKLQVKEKMK